MSSCSADPKIMVRQSVPIAEHELARREAQAIILRLTESYANQAEDNRVEIVRLTAALEERQTGADALRSRIAAQHEYARLLSEERTSNNQIRERLRAEEEEVERLKEELKEALATVDAVRARILSQNEYGYLLDVERTLNDELCAKLRLYEPDVDWHRTFVVPSRRRQQQQQPGPAPVPEPVQERINDFVVRQCPLLRYEGELLSYMANKSDFLSSTKGS